MTALGRIGLPGTPNPAGRRLSPAAPRRSPARRERGGSGDGLLGICHPVFDPAVVQVLTVGLSEGRSRQRDGARRIGSSGTIEALRDAAQVPAIFAGVA